MLVHNSFSLWCALAISSLCNVSCFLISYIFLSWKVIFWWHEFEPRTYGYLLSTHTFALRNGLPPATYAFCLGIFLGWIEVVWPNNFSSWVQQKSWSAMWSVFTLVFFFCIFGSLSFLQHQREGLRPPGFETATSGCPPSLQSCALPTELAAGIQAFCLIDLFGEATLYGQFILVRNSVPACCALLVSFLSYTSCFFVSYVFFLKSDFCGDTNSNLGPTDIFIHYTPSLFRMGSSQLPMFSL